MEKTIRADELKALAVNEKIDLKPMNVNETVVNLNGNEIVLNREMSVSKMRNLIIQLINKKEQMKGLLYVTKNCQQLSLV